jgi:hypothetical protein
VSASDDRAAVARLPLDTLEAALGVKRGSLAVEVATIEGRPPVTLTRLAHERVAPADILAAFAVAAGAEAVPVDGYDHAALIDGWLVVAAPDAVFLVESTSASLARLALETLAVGSYR